MRTSTTARAATCWAVPAFLLLTILCTSAHARGHGYIPGELLVKFRDGTTVEDKTRLHTSLRTRIKKELRRLHLQRLKLPGELSVEEAVRRYRQDPGVEFAEPNYLVHALATTPDDPSFDQLWGLNNAADTDIDGPEAWDITTGSDSVIIAVIDSGLALIDSGLAEYNPEFLSNIWTNEAELGGQAGVDDDGNGYIDDFYGWDFIGEDGYPLDLNGHGTHVAGTIAAQGDNGLGISGVMWNARIMAVRFLGLTGSGSIADAIDAIVYAYDNGARIMSNSWGSEYFSQSLKNTIENYAPDALFIFAAGNTGLDNDDDSLAPIYPASFNSPNIISVAATDSTDSLAGFSSFGEERVDLGAPGTSIYSTIPRFSYENLTTIYPEEDFEGPTGDLPLQGWERGGTDSAWAITAGTGVGGSNSLEDSPGNAFYDRNAKIWANYATPINSAVKGKRYLLTFDWRGYLEANWDWLDMVYCNGISSCSVNGDWDWIDYRTGNQPAFATYTADYTSVAETFDSFYFGFRIDADPISDERDGVYIDNVTMTSQDIFVDPYNYNTPGVNYAYSNGTSMATPHVSGVAGLLLSLNPDLTNIQLKNLILNSVDPVPGLADRVATGGRLNAHAALLNAPPAAPSDLSAATVSDTGIDLSWSDNSGNETDFRIERKTGAGGAYAQIVIAGQNATTYSDTGLASSTSYFYRIRSNNGNGSSAYSNEAEDTTMDNGGGGGGGTAGGGGGGGGGGCFISTAAH